MSINVMYGHREERNLNKLLKGVRDEVIRLKFNRPNLKKEDLS